MDLYSQQFKSILQKIFIFLIELVVAYAIITRNPWSAVLPVFLFCFFAFYSIPLLDAHLAQIYPDQFADYQKHTKRLIPFLY